MKPRLSEVRRCQPLLGTFVELGLADDARPASELHALASAAFERIARVHRMMSFHDATSELSQLNQRAHREPVRVDSWTRKVITEAVRYGELSDGAFDVTIAPVLTRRGFLPRHKFATRPQRSASFRDIDLSRDLRIRFACALQVDLGGIAKGFAVDQASELLESAGVRRAVVNAGGDLRFIGELPDTIAVRNPAAPHSEAFEIELRAPAVATSAAYFAKRGRHSHIIDPRSRGSLSDRISATVFAPTCLQADALAKIALLADANTASMALKHEHATCVFLGEHADAKTHPQVAA